MRREREFYKARNMPCPKDLPQNHDVDDNDKANEAHAESDYHRQDEQVNVCLECITNNFEHLKRRFIRCSSQATITHLKKFVAKKVLNGTEKYREVSVFSISLSEQCNIMDSYYLFLRLIFCAMMNSSVRIIRSNLST